jgi:hypothetical protein
MSGLIGTISDSGSIAGWGVHILSRVLSMWTLGVLGVTKLKGGLIGGGWASRRGCIRGWGICVLMGCGEGPGVLLELMDVRWLDMPSATWAGWRLGVCHD